MRTEPHGARLWPGRLPFPAPLNQPGIAAGIAAAAELPNFDSNVA